MLNFGRQQRRCERGIALGEWESCDQVGGGSGFRSGCRLISGYNTKSQHGSKGSMGFGCDSVVVLWMLQKLFDVSFLYWILWLAKMWKRQLLADRDYSLNVTEAIWCFLCVLDFRAGEIAYEAIDCRSWSLFECYRSYLMFFFVYWFLGNAKTYTKQLIADRGCPFNVTEVYWCIRFVLSSRIGENAYEAIVCRSLWTFEYTWHFPCFQWTPDSCNNQWLKESSTCEHAKKMYLIACRCCSLSVAGAIRYYQWIKESSACEHAKGVLICLSLLIFECYRIDFTSVLVNGFDYSVGAQQVAACSSLFISEGQRSKSIVRLFDVFNCTTNVISQLRSFLWDRNTLSIEHCKRRQSRLVGACKMFC